MRWSAASAAPGSASRCVGGAHAALAPSLRAAPQACQVAQGSVPWSAWRSASERTGKRPQCPHAQCHDSTTRAIGHSVHHNSRMNTARNSRRARRIAVPEREIGWAQARGGSSPAPGTSSANELRGRPGSGATCTAARVVARFVAHGEAGLLDRRSENDSHKAVSAGSERAAIGERMPGATAMGEAAGRQARRHRRRDSPSRCIGPTPYPSVTAEYRM